MEPASLTSGFQPLPLASHNQIGPLWCLFLSRWACAHSRPLWISPTPSPVRLEVSPTAAPTPRGLFNQRFEALFPRTGALGYEVYFAPRRSSRFICVRMWGRRLPAPFVPHSASLGPAMATRVLSTPVPVSAPPTGLDVCFFFIYLVSGLPCRSIFCQFWLYEEMQCVYLRRHLGSPLFYPLLLSLWLIL